MVASSNGRSSIGEIDQDSVPQSGGPQSLLKQTPKDGYAVHDLALATLQGSADLKIFLYFLLESPFEKGEGRHKFYQDSCMKTYAENVIGALELKITVLYVKFGPWLLHYLRM